MCLKTVLLITFLSNWLHKVHASPTNKNVIQETLVQVPFGETVTLTCESNDANHTFFYWFINEKNVIIGPSNSYDNGKFRYEVLSGNLTVKAVSKEEEGVYNCVSRGVVKDDFKIRSVRMVVAVDWEEVLEEDPNVNLFRVVVVVGTLMILSGVGYAGYRIWKTRYRHPAYLTPSDEEEDELFSTPEGPGGSESLLKNNSTDSFESPGISTDFRSILATASKK